jgi:hypothetical protein
MKRTVETYRDIKTYLEFKHFAKALKKEGVGSAHAYEILSRSLGYKSHNALLESLEIKHNEN